MTTEVDTTTVVRGLLTDRVRAVYRAGDTASSLTALAELEKKGVSARAMAHFLRQRQQYPRRRKIANE